MLYSPLQRFITEGKQKSAAAVGIDETHVARRQGKGIVGNVFERGFRPTVMRPTEKAVEIEK